MKQLIIVLIIVSMAFGFWLIFPVIIGLKAIKRLQTAEYTLQLGMYPVLVLLFVNVLAGILMLSLKDSDLES